MQLLGPLSGRYIYRQVLLDKVIDVLDLACDHAMTVILLWKGENIISSNGHCMHVM